MTSASPSGRAVRVRVPASSANLGPGFDTFAAALDCHLEVEVEQTGQFAIETKLPVATGRENLLVRAFERLHAADGLRFTVRSAIPLVGGLGSSAAAIVAGMLAAKEMFSLDVDVSSAASAMEGHPDNVAAALHGGFVICADGGAVRFEPPTGLEALLLIPEHPVPTERARAALASCVPLSDASANIAYAGLLILGLCRGDWDLIARGLKDRLHERQRSHLFPSSYALMQRAEELGALGATISGAGPTVLFWCFYEQTGVVAGALAAEAAGWATVRRVSFSCEGATALSAA